MIFFHYSLSSSTSFIRQVTTRRRSCYFSLSLLLLLYQSLYFSLQGVVGSGSFKGGINNTCIPVNSTQLLECIEQYVLLNVENGENTEIQLISGEEKYSELFLLIS